MMIELFSVYDSAAERYLDPFCAPTPDVALRGFRSVVNKPGHPFNEYPADYTLFHVGTFNPDTGIVMSEVPHSLGNAVQYVERAPVDVREGNGMMDRSEDVSVRSLQASEQIREVIDAD